MGSTPPVLDPAISGVLSNHSNSPVRSSPSSMESLSLGAGQIPSTRLMPVTSAELNLATMFSPFLSPFLGTPTGFWPGLPSADYFYLASLFGAVPPVATVGCANSSVPAGTFPDLLHQLARVRPRSNDGDCKTRSKRAKVASGISTMCQPNANGQTSADEEKEEATLEVNRVESSLDQKTMESAPLDFSKKRPVSSNNLCPPTSKCKRATVVDNDVRANSFDVNELVVNGTTDAKSGIDVPCDNGGPKAATNVQLDQNLLNASAVAWATLSNQMLLSSLQERGMAVGSAVSRSYLAPSSSLGRFNEATLNCHYATSNEAQLTGYGRRRASRGRPATISVDDSGKDERRSSVDDIINDVVGHQSNMGVASNLAASSPMFEQLLQNRSATLNGRRIRGKLRRGCSRFTGRGSRGGFTVREQLALKRAGVIMPTDEDDALVNGHAEDEDSNLALDLSIASSGASGISSLCEDAESSQLKDCPQTRRHKHSPDVDMLCIPLSHGWRRQTVIRHLSSSGVRGDVLYYAPCGKRLTSYAEVSRYLRKQGIENLSRKHFSLSSKVVIGDFLYNKNDGSKNCMVKLTESDVLIMMERLNSLSNSDVDACARLSEATVDQANTNRPLATTSIKRRGSGGTRPLSRQKVANALKAGDKVDVLMDHQGWLKRQQSGQDVRKVVEQAKRHAGDQRKIDLQSKLAKFCQMRLPVEDMELDQTKRLPDMKRIENLQLDGAAFADLLLVFTFLTTFGDVLKIDKNEVPSLSSMHAGILNNPAHRQCVVSLTKMLLTLVLEYPGLPSGATSRSCTGQSRRELKVTKNNYGELMRMFLASRRDPNGPELAAYLENSSFERLKSDVKCRILAYMCDELLHCRNVVREIENSMEVLAKLKSDKWSLKGRIRALHTLQCQKSESAEEKSDLSQKQNENPLRVKGDKEPCFEHELSAEEKALSPDEIKIKIGIYSEDVEKMNFTIRNSSHKIRSLPLGQDRFQRYYWMLPQYSGILVESVESSCRSNEALNKQYLKPSLKWQDGSAANLHVRDCVADLIDTVVKGVDLNNAHEEQHYSEPSTSKEQYQTGWWTLDTPEVLESLTQSLNQKGIRERLFGRSLARQSEQCKDMFNSSEKKTVSISPASIRAPVGFKSELQNVLKALIALEEKCFQANIHNTNWSPEDWKMCQKRTWKSNEELLTFIQDRLLLLQRSIEKRYFLPFVNNGCIKLVPSSPPYDCAKPTSSAVVECNSDLVPVQLAAWRNGVTLSKTAAQLFMCIDALESFVAWEKSIMKATCQICRDDSNESQLLLCDGCDLGYHTYCFMPKMEKVPDEDWYCPECVAKATRRACCLICCRHSALPMISCCGCKREFHFECAGIECYKKTKQDWFCQGCCRQRDKKCAGKHWAANKKDKVNSSEKTPKAQPKKIRKTKVVGLLENANETEKKKKTVDNAVVGCSDAESEEICATVLAELDAHRDAWPFKMPVDTKVIPLYKKVIKSPMDLSTIHTKLVDHSYQTSEDFIKDVNLIFDNCQTFNEDDSKIGKAGHCLRRFFTRRWKELKKAKKQ